MEDFLWMLKQASWPVLIGSIMALSLSRWSLWERRGRARAGFYYEWLILFGILLSPIDYREISGLREGVAAAFGVGISMSLYRQSEALLHRVVADVFFLLYGGLVALLVGPELVDWVERAFR